MAENGNDFVRTAELPPEAWLADFRAALREAVKDERSNLALSQAIASSLPSVRTAKTSASA